MPSIVNWCEFKLLLRSLSKSGGTKPHISWPAEKLALPMPVGCVYASTENACRMPSLLLTYMVSGRDATTGRWRNRLKASSAVSNCGAPTITGEE